MQGGGPERALKNVKLITQSKGMEKVKDQTMNNTEQSD